MNSLCCSRLLWLSCFQSFSKNWFRNIDFGYVALDCQSYDPFQTLIGFAAGRLTSWWRLRSTGSTKKKENAANQAHRDPLSPDFKGDESGARSCFLRHAESSASIVELCCLSFFTSESNESHRRMMTLVSSAILPFKAVPFDDLIYLSARQILCTPKMQGICVKLGCKRIIFKLIFQFLAF